MREKLKILIAEDFEDDANLMKIHLAEGGIIFEAKIATTKKEFEEALDNFHPDAVLCDHTLPSFDSVQALKILDKKKKNIPFILVTGSVSEEFAVQMMHSGASDYIIKDRMTRLPSAVMNAIQRSRTEREKIEYFERILDNEALFKKAEKIAHFGIWERDILKGISKWSDETFRILGYESGEVEPTEENFFKKIHPDDREYIRNIVQNALINERIGQMEFRVTDKDNGIKKIRSEFIVERDENNRNVKLIGFNIDITEEKKAQENLLKSLKETSDYKYALDESTIVAITDSSGIITHANDNFCKISRFKREELVGQDHSVISSGYHSKEVIQNLFDTIYAGKIWRGELKNKAKDGTFFWIDMTIVPFLGTDGKPYQHVAISKDITARKEGEENLVRSERRFRQFFESAPEAVLILDIDKKVFVDFNDNALNLLKTTREDLMNKSPLDVSAAIQPEGISSIEKMFNNISRIVAGEKLTSEWLVFNSEGKNIFCEVRASMLSEYDNNLMRLSVTDITDRKNAELEKSKITADLFTRNKDLEQFNYIVSHNLRSPVANILGFSEELEKTDLSEDEKLFLNKELHQAVKKLDEVIMDLNEILNVSSTLKEKKEEVFFANIVHNIKIGIKNLIANNEVEIITDFKAAHGFTTIKSYIHSIFYNLISNSIKYRQPDIKPVIEISSHINNGKLILVFKDNGMGINVIEKRDQIFGLYKRFHHNIEGKGMGLFMIKSQISALRGNISIESEINKGTTFTIEFNL